MNLELFHHNDWSVRVLDLDGEPWFLAMDVCAALGLTNVGGAMARLDEDEKGSIRLTDGTSGNPNKAIVSEPGLFALVLRSDKPDARAFRRWITHEVLPAIRRTGTYSVAPQFEIPTTLAGALQLAADQARELEVKTAELAAARPMAEMAEHLIDAGGDYSVRDAAQALSRDHGIEIGQNRLFKYLREIRWIDSRSIPYQAQVDAGRLAVRLTTYEDPYSGEMKVKTQVRVTAKGVRALHEMLRTPTPAGLVLVGGGAA